MRRHIVLVGLPGSGKTTVGRRVAELLETAFTDIDETVELATGKCVAEVFYTMGEPGFRELERASMDGALAAPPHVIAPGGGWIAQPGNLEAAERAGALLVLLRVTSAVAAGRLVGDTSRALLRGDDTAGRLETLLRERESWYLRASSVVDGSALPDAVADGVVLAARREAGW